MHTRLQDIAPDETMWALVTQGIAPPEAAPAIRSPAPKALPDGMQWAPGYRDASR